ncbi:hypothetical protein Glove_60g156 [Diversispora epigaea]|uniref:TLDc domain-containing protein n=1 Tax=Diversispora epigaea TaxID=1348612 RepID=A0A397JIM5_9GLOM|nr:hypothetical protein Glove_60g156 [Diversispora epigaea]
MPYKRILDKQLWKDIIQHMAIPGQPVKSNILPERWVMVSLNPHAKVLKKPFSRIISKECELDISELIILGGYNPLAWNNTYCGFLSDSKWMETKDIKKLERAIWNKSGIYHDKNGPRFGDFYICNEHDFNLSKFNNRYEKPIRISSLSDYFSIDNYEVFKIVRKS